MANTKVTQHVIADDAITTSMITDANVTPAKLHGTLDLSSKTLTLPAVAIPSASTATTQSQSDGSTKVATTAYVDTAITNLIDSAPGTLNTLNELAAALNDDASFNTTISNSVAAKLPLAGGTMTGDLILGDSVKLEVGSASGGDLQIYHDGSNSYIDDAGTGNLLIRGSEVVLGNDAKKGVRVIADGAVQLRHNDTTMLETAATGVNLSGTGALRIPQGTTGQRPSAATGQIRWNTTDGALEVYNGSAWTAVGTSTSNKVLNTFTGDGSTAAFTLTVTPANEDALMIFIDGVYQEKGDYSLSSAVLTLDTAPASGEKVACHITTASVHDGTSAVNQQFTGDGSTTAFTLSSAPGSENNTQVYVNGVYQVKTAYSVSGTTLTFSSAPANSAVIEVNSFTVTTLGNTDTVAEGSSNLYHTSARAISAISAGNLTGLTVDTNVLKVDASNNRVGINVTSPSHGLHVVGGDNDEARIRVHNSASGQSSFDLDNSEGYFRMFTDAGELRFYDQTDGAYRARFDTSGKFAIGSHSPNANLHVGSSSATGDATNPAIQVGGSGTYRLGLFTTAEAGVIDNANGDDGIQFHTKNAGEAVRIGASGQIGIGGANYGTDGQILTSTGASTAPAWEDAPASGPSKGLAIVLGMIF